MKSLKKKILQSRFRASAFIGVGLLVGIVYWCFFTSFTASSSTQYLYIDADDTIDSVFVKAKVVAQGKSIAGFATLMRHTDYDENIRTGCYAIEPGELVVTVFRKVKNGRQTPVKVTLPSVRTTERLAQELSQKLMPSKEEFLKALTSDSVCSNYGYTKETIVCMFIPNSYELYWNTPVLKFFDRMQKESKVFWNEQRLKKAEALGLTPEEVVTLASIVEEETANNPEKPMIAGMYYNRLQKKMPLQADPTIKFARKDFAARRIYREWLKTESPYNTYINQGLPPGPIRIPSVAGIDAVLNMVQHNYMYMCAKEDFSGTHNFAVTYPEHLQNAARYSAALNARGIK